LAARQSFWAAVAVAYALLLFTWPEVEAIRVQLALFASMAPVVAALMLTFSRGAFLVFIVVNVLFLLWRRQGQKTLVFCRAPGGGRAASSKRSLRSRGNRVRKRTQRHQRRRIERALVAASAEILRSPFTATASARFSGPTPCAARARSI